MPGKWPQYELPNLTDSNSRITSPCANAYNCIAWAAGDVSRWWWPTPMLGVAYWPKGIPRQQTIEVFMLAFGTLGYVECVDGSLEPGVEKIALFAISVAGYLLPTHAALQLESGEWTSKLGPFEDVAHKTLAAVQGPVYGAPVKFLHRPRARAIP